MSGLDGINVVPGPSAERWNERQIMDYRHERVQCLEWHLAFGKEPEQADGYAHSTVSGRANRMDQFYRWVWSGEDGYTTDVKQTEVSEEMERDH